MLPTTPQKATHDYVRNGTLDLFAALEVATGEVITDLRKSHTAADFIAFLNKDRPRGHRRPRRSAHRSVQALAQGIRDWVETWNDNPRPFTWHKRAEEILDRLAGYCRSLNKWRALQPDRTLGPVPQRHGSARLRRWPPEDGPVVSRAGR
jgi:PAS domain-containing protein